MKVRKEDAERMRKKLVKAGIFDSSRQIVVDGEWIYLPVISSIPGAIAAELPERRMRGSPYALISRMCRDRCAGCTPPDYWERIGRVILLPEDWDYSHCDLSILGQIYGKVLNAYAVAIYHRVHGELREQAIEVVWGHRTDTVHVENGIKYELDLSRLMFSSGNVNERIRMSRVGNDNEIVVDMFAGIGYFTLPISMNVKRVYSCEKNPYSYFYLVRNIYRNRANNVFPIYGDNREVCPEGIAHRVIMGYFGTEKFFPKALRILRPAGGVVHYHDLFRDDDANVIERLGEMASKAKFAIQDYSVRTVKSYAPHVYHRVYELYLSRV